MPTEENAPIALYGLIFSFLRWATNSSHIIISLFASFVFFRSNEYLLLSLFVAAFILRWLTIGVYRRMAGQAHNIPPITTLVSLVCGLTFWVMVLYSLYLAYAMYYR